MHKLSKKLPPIGKRVLVWLVEHQEWEIDKLRQKSPSDGEGVEFIGWYTHNISHWMHLPEGPRPASE